MIEVKIPKEIRAYKERLMFGLSLRQLLCTVIVIMVNVPLYWYGRGVLGDELTSWIVIFVAMPISLIGYFHYNGMTFEQFIKAMLQSEWIYPQKRIYQTVNLFEVTKSFKEGEVKKYEFKSFIRKKKNKDS